MNFDIEKLQKISILYVEDEEIVRKQTVSVLNTIFKRIYAAVDGKDGLEIYKENKENIDVIVSDINMPNLNGLEMSEEIFKINSNIPIIITTAYTDEKYLLKSIDLNIFKYITKPIKIKELTTEIAQAYDEYSNKINRTKNTEALVSKYINTEKKANTLHAGFSSSQKKITFQKEIINKYVCYLKVDQNGEIIEASDKFCSLYEYNKSEILNKNISIIAQNINILQKKMFNAIREKRIQKFTETFLTKKSKILTFDCEIHPVRQDSTLINGFYLYQDLAN